jgi:hypothetical protein
MNEPLEHGEVLKANTPGDQVKVGMDVNTVDGQHLGKVKEIRGDEFLLDRPFARDLWVPLSSVMATEEYRTNYRGGVSEPEQVVLNISAAHLDSQGWRHS